MKETLFFLLLGFYSQSANAQWHKVHDFTDSATGINELIKCVYFIDIPGPPRIGFVGTESELWKTSDGGETWRDVFPHKLGGGDEGVYNIFFKDSLTGWISYWGLNPGLYGTTDGGENWVLLRLALYPLRALHFCPTSNLLLLGGRDSMYSSPDLGNSWQSVLPCQALDFSFSTDFDGISSAWFIHPDTDSAGISVPRDTEVTIRTTDAGKTWQCSDSSYPITFGADFPLAIPNAAVCFAVPTLRIRVLRSDNYGKSWHQIADFGPDIDTNTEEEIGPVGFGAIRGDISRLYISSDSGMFVSTDQGITWKNDGGPTAESDFYAAKGITMAGQTNLWDAPVSSGGLWEEIWPNSGVIPGASVPVLDASIFPNPTPGHITIRGAAGAITVTNVLGEVVAVSGNRIPGTGEAQLDLSKLPAGMYFIRLTGPDGRATVSRVVKE